MARVDKAAYRTMIAALTSAAQEISSNAENMKSLSDSCATALGDDDVGAGQLKSQMNDCVKKYLEAAKTAAEIAKAMQAELDQAEKEDSVWSED